MREQHDHHCIMNVDWQPWRIHWVKDGEMGVAFDGVLQIADLNKIDWVTYCDNARAYLLEEQAREKREAAWRKGKARRREEEARAIEAARKAYAARQLQEAREFHCWRLAHERLLASGYGPIDDLEDEVVLVDLEFTDVESITDVATEGRSTRSRLAQGGAADVDDNVGSELAFQCPDDGQAR